MIGLLRREPGSMTAKRGAKYSLNLLIGPGIYGVWVPVPRRMYQMRRAPRLGAAILVAVRTRR